MIWNYVLTAKLISREDTDFKQLIYEDLFLKHPDKSVSAEGLYAASLRILAEIPYFPTTLLSAQMTCCATL